MKLKEQTNSKKQGNVGIGAAIAYFTEQGYTVSIPLNDTQEYDLVVDMGGHLKKVQVKTTVHRIKTTNNFSVKLCSSNINGNVKFNNKQVDYVFVLTEEKDKYFIPACDIEAENALALGEKYKKYIIS